jgi:hypothetical protein
MSTPAILFLDIETVSATKTYQDLSPERQHLRDHKIKNLVTDELSPAMLYEQKA